MSSELDQEKFDESVSAVLLKEEKIKKETEADVIVISDSEVELPDFLPIPLALPITETYRNNQKELHSMLKVRQRCLSEPLSDLISFDGCSSIESLAQRRCLYVPKDFKGLKVRQPQVIVDYVDLDLIESDSDSVCIAEETEPQPILKRKRSLIPSHYEVENTRKTMKPGPKSKTRNIATVHQMITEAKMVGSGVTFDCSDTSDEEMILDADSEDEELPNDDENECYGEEEDETSNIDQKNDYENENDGDENESLEYEEEDSSIMDTNDDFILINSSA